MLQEHMDEVKELLLSKKQPDESCSENGFKSTKDDPEAFRSPPLGIGGLLQTDNGADPRKTSATPGRTSMPPIGFFSASPGSPMKRNL
jgi:hypothetical protein